MKLVVTGAAGFIGSNICSELASHGDSKIVAIDDLSTGKRENLDGIDGQKMRLHNVSVLDKDKLGVLFKDADYVIHQAAIPSVPKSVRDPIGTTNANIMGTLTVLMTAKECNVKRVVLASSSSVYGDTPTLPKKEEMVPNPMSPYGISKYANELHARNFYELYGLETICLRYFNVFGPRQNPESEYAAVIPKFITKMLKGESPVVFGDGTATRDFSYVKDVVKANLLAMTAKKEACGKVFNIAGGRTITINGLIETINKIMKKRILPIHGKERQGDIKHSYADISLANKILGFKPEYNVETGLNETIAWFERYDKR